MIHSRWNGTRAPQAVVSVMVSGPRTAFCTIPCFPVMQIKGLASYTEDQVIRADSSPRTRPWTPHLPGLAAGFTAVTKAAVGRVVQQLPAEGKNLDTYIPRLQSPSCFKWLNALQFTKREISPKHTDAALTHAACHSDRPFWCRPGRRDPKPRACSG